MAHANTENSGDPAPSGETPPAAAEPAAAEHEAVEPDVAEHDVVEPDAAEPDVAEHDAAEPDVAEPDVAEHDAAELDIVEPVVEVTAIRHEFRGPRPGRLGRFGSFGRRHRVTAIDGISFTIAPGEAVGYIGPRGVGKTTMVELLTGILAPTSGTIRTCGLLPGPGSVGLTSRVGVVFGNRPQLLPDLPLSESLRILASIHRLPERRWIARRTELVERLGLAAFLDLPLGQLQPDRRIRGEIAAALLHEPELVVLDEPMVGLDVRSKERLRSFLRQEHRVHGRTLLITSSQIGDVEQFCDRLLVVDQGQLAYDGDLDGLIARTDAERVLVIDLHEADLLLDDVPGTRLFSVEAGGLRQRLSFSPGNISTARVLADVAARTTIRDLTLVEVPIEDVVRRLTTHL
jgi:ABC-2 type transport system ATP-binding protein